MRIFTTRSLFWFVISMAILSGCTVSAKQAEIRPTAESSATIVPTVPMPSATTDLFPTRPPVPSQVITESPVVVETATAYPFPTMEETEVTQTTESSVKTLPPGERPKASPIENTNCHKNPGSQTNIVGYFLVGMQSGIYGKNPTEDWILIVNPDRDGVYCWVWIGRLNISGSLTNVEIIQQKLE